MGLFSKNSSGVRYGAIVDVGSGSVLAAIVRSDPKKSHPEIIWSKREYVLLKDTVSLDQSAKNILTALVNSVLILGSEGQKSLLEVDPKATVTQLQMSICAPWSYTISKTVTYSDDEPFQITRALISDLVETAQKKTLEDLKENEITELLGLDIIARTATDLIANGYRTEAPFGQMVNKIGLAYVSAVAQQDLVHAVEDARNKIIPGTKLEKFSFMLVYFCVIRELYPNTTEFCLVDVTYEATEICIVRDGILRFTTHVPFGVYSLARELATALDVPKSDAFSLVRTAEAEQSIEHLTAKQREAFQRIIKEYQNAVAELFKQTGDALSIPKTIFLHADLYTEMFFRKHISEAARLATNSTHTIHEVTSELLTKQYNPKEKEQLTKGVSDTALLLSAQFFHKLNHCSNFEQL